MATKDIAKFHAAEARIWERYGVTPVDRRLRLASGGEVRVQELGDGPPFILIHGASVGGSSWSHLATAIEGVRCIMVDRPGCGLSDPIVGGPLDTLERVQEYADRLVPDLLDALGLEEAAIGCTSYGAFFGIRGAAVAPDRVTKLVSYSWPIGAPSEKAPLFLRIGAIPGVQEFSLKMPMPKAMIKPMLKQIGLKRAIESGVFDETMLDWIYNLFTHTDTLANETRSTPKLFTPIKGQNRAVEHTDELLAKLTMPSLFLWGDSDPNGGAVIARDFVARIPNGELVVLPGAEHAPWFDDLETCAARTQDFLTS